MDSCAKVNLLLVRNQSFRLRSMFLDGNGVGLGILDPMVERKRTGSTISVLLNHQQLHGLLMITQGVSERNTDCAKS